MKTINDVEKILDTKSIIKSPLINTQVYLTERVILKNIKPKIIKLRIKKIRCFKSDDDIKYYIFYFKKLMFSTMFPCIVNNNIIGYYEKCDLLSIDMFRLLKYPKYILFFNENDLNKYILNKE